MQFDLSPTFEPKEKERWKLTPLWSVERKQFLIVGKKNKAAEKTSHGKEEGGDKHTWRAQYTGAPRFLSFGS